MRPSGQGAQRSGEDIEVRFGGPGVAVADDVETPPGSGDGDVEEVWCLRREVAGARLGGIAAEHEDHDIGFLALHGVDGAYPLGAVLAADVGEN